MHLHQLPLGQPAYIDRVEWDRLSPGEAQRLREFGVEEGASVEALHRAGLFGQGALACRIGRMTVAMRHVHADAIHVRTGAEDLPRPIPAAATGIASPSPEQAPSLS